MKLYSIKNVLTSTFNPPFVARDEVDAKETIRKAIIGGRDISLLIELENLFLFEVGDFNATTGLFSTCDFEPFAVVCLDEISLPQHLTEMINKMKEVKNA